jgi:uncharacterized membrane protein YtjA (UPF0391 family)
MHCKVLGGNGPSPRQSARAKSLVIMAFIGLCLTVSAPMALADCPLTDPTCNVDQTMQTATDTTNSVKDKADAAVKQATDVVDGILKPVVSPTPTPTPTGGGGGGHRGGGGTVPSGRPATTSVSGGVGSQNRDTSTGTSTQAPASSRPVRERTTDGPSLFGRIGGAAAEAAKQVAFPLALALVVVAFLMVQNRLDRRDPKLASAPIAPDVRRFE